MNELLHALEDLSHTDGYRLAEKLGADPDRATRTVYVAGLTETITDMRDMADDLEAKTLEQETLIEGLMDDRETLREAIRDALDGALHEFKDGGSRESAVQAIADAIEVLEPHR